MIPKTVGVALALCCAAAAYAQQRSSQSNAAGPNFVSAAQLKQAIADAKPWASDPSIRYKRLGARGNYTYWILQRDAPGKVEQHDDWNDIFIVQSGEATVLHGGTISGGDKTGPGETLGGEIVGGQRHRLVPNDLLIIPAGEPHQFIVEPGKAIVYVTVKTQRGGGTQ